MILALWIAYLAVVVWYVPEGHGILLGPGVLALVVFSTLARSWGEATHPGTEPLGVFLAAMAFFAFPAAFVPPPRGPAFVAGALGALCLQAVWAVYRYPVVVRPPEAPPRRLFADLRWGFTWGIGLAVVFSAYVAVLLFLDALGTENPLFGTRPLWFIGAAYFAGGMSGGVIAGLLRPASRWPLGAMAMGILVAFPAYWAVSLVVPYIDADEGLTTFREQLVAGFVCALMVGPPAALAYRSSFDEEAA